VIVINGRFATYGEVWFDENPPGHAGVDVLMFRQRSRAIDGHVCKTCMSLVNDLSVSEDTIMAAFGNTNRYKIKRASSKDGLEAECLANPRTQLERFSDFYDEFARQRGLPLAYRRGLNAACEAGQLHLTYAAKGGWKLVWHAYITHGQKIALLHSASLFRDMRNVDRALLGRANRWLHWRDMLHFKQMGLRCYDWGGVFEDESSAERAGINTFKREFGGNVVRTFNCNVAVTLKGRAYLALRNIHDRFEAKSRR
jgi:hypothetical protein